MNNRIIASFLCYFNVYRLLKPKSDLLCCIFQTLTSVSLEPIVAINLLHVPILLDHINVHVTRVTLVMAGPA